MRRLIGWIIAVFAAAPLFGAGCSASVRDAFMSGAMDFVSGSTTDALSALLPIATGG